MGLSALAVPRETSPGKNVYCPSIYRVHLRDARLTVLGFVLFGELAPRAPPRMHFLFVRPEVCRRLPCRFSRRVQGIFLDLRESIRHWRGYLERLPWATKPPLKSEVPAP